MTNHFKLFVNAQRFFLLLLTIIQHSEQFQPLNISTIRRNGIHNDNSFIIGLVPVPVPVVNYKISQRDLAKRRKKNTDSESSASSPPSSPPPPPRRKKKIVINTNLIGVENVSSDGLLTEQKKKQKEAQEKREGVKSNLGVTSKKTKKKKTKSDKKLSIKAQKIADQRTANGTVDGTLQAGLALPEDQKIEIQEVKRGNKQVTIVRGFTCPMDERKKILKEIKKKIGGGGSLIQGIVELQGSHADVVLKTLKSKGYVQAAKQK